MADDKKVSVQSIHSISLKKKAGEITKISGSIFLE